MYLKLEKEVAVYEEKLANMFDFMPTERENQNIFLVEIAILICYIKRKYDLFYIKNSSGDNIQVSQLISYIKEFTEISSLIGVQCMILCDLTDEISINNFILFYDFFYSLLEWGIHNKNKMIYLKILSENKQIVMKLLMPHKALKYELPKYLQNDIKSLKGFFKKESIEDITEICLYLKKHDEKRLRNIENDIEKLLYIKIESHDIYSGKLTLLLQAIRNNVWPNDEIFNVIKLGGLKNIDKDKAIKSENKLKKLIYEYKQSDVKIQIKGNLPENEHISFNLVKILQEAIANSIIHGYANEVYVKILSDEKQVIMQVTDNSGIVTTEIEEGGGITGMRNRLSKLNGILNIDTKEQFKLTVAIPKKEDNIGRIN